MVVQHDMTPLVGQAKCTKERLGSPTTGVLLIFSGRGNKETCQHEAGTINMNIAGYGANSTSTGEHLSRWENTNEKRKQSMAFENIREETSTEKNETF